MDIAIRDPAHHQMRKKAKGWRLLLFVLIVTVLSATFTHQYISRETPGYYWDFSNYSGQLQYYTEWIRRGDVNYVIGLALNSIRTSDYNTAPILPLVPIALIFGDSRFIYILSLVFLYLIPACIVLALLIKECAKGNGRDPSLLLILGLVILYPNFWAATLRGYPDIAGLIPMGLAGLLILRSDWLVKAGIKQSICIGVLLWCSVLMRRHFAYTVIAILIATALFALASLLFKEATNKQSLLIRLSCNLLAVLISIALPAVIVQGPLIAKIINTSYTDIYSAYQLDWLLKLQLLYDRNGPVWTFLLIAGIIYALRIRNSKSLFCLSVGISSYLLFQRVQAPGIHHSMAFAFWLAPIAAWPASLISLQPNVLKRFGMSGLLLGVLASASVPMLAWPQLRSIALLKWSRPLQPKETFPPFRLASYRSVMRLVKELEKEKYANKSIWILASSEHLNASIVQSLNPALKNRVFSAGDIDKRDGFASDMAFSADYVVATWKPTLSLRAQDQQVVVIPSKALFDRDSEMSRHYVQISDISFPLNDGSSAVIFKRVSKAESNAITWLTTEFQKTYPKWIYSNGRIGPP